MMCTDRMDRIRYLYSYPPESSRLLTLEDYWRFGALKLNFKGNIDEWLGRFCPLAMRPEAPGGHPAWCIVWSNCVSSRYGLSTSDFSKRWSAPDRNTIVLPTWNGVYHQGRNPYTFQYLAYFTRPHGMELSKKIFECLNYVFWDPVGIKREKHNSWASGRKSNPRLFESGPVLC